jgi:hypothetical protein
MNRIWHLAIRCRISRLCMKFESLTHGCRTRKKLAKIIGKASNTGLWRRRSGGGFMLEGENVFVLIPLAFIAACMLGLVITEVRKYATRRHELEIKRDMVERGLSAEEIERVIAARVPGDK